MLDGARTVFGDARLRTLMLLAWLAAFYVVPEGLAPSYVAAIGGSTAAVGAIMAADPAGSAIGAALFVRLVPARVRVWLMSVLAFAAGVPLILCGLMAPGIVMSVLLLAATGLCSAFQVQASTTFMRVVPDDRRGQAFGLAQSGLIAVQGLGIAVFGFVGDQIGAPHAIALAGAIGSALAIVLGVSWERARRAHQRTERKIPAGVGSGSGRNGRIPRQAEDVG
jgi:MFS family permease